MTNKTKKEKEKIEPRRSHRKTTINFVYINVCEGCGKEFKTQKASIRFHSEHCMKEYFEKKYGDEKNT